MLKSLSPQVHFIFRHKNPKTGEFEEKHLKLPPTPSIEKTTNLYTLIVKPDNTFQVLINGDSVKTGSLLEDFNPAVNPAKEIGMRFIAELDYTTFITSAL